MIAFVIGVYITMLPLSTRMVYNVLCYKNISRTIKIMIKLPSHQNLDVSDRLILLFIIVTYFNVIHCFIIYDRP